MDLNIVPNGAIKRVHVSQNDVGRTLTFELFNNSTSYTIPSGAVVKIQGTKPSGFGFSETCSVSGNVVTVDTTETMTDEFGYIDTELQITYSGNKIGTSNFVLAVEKNPHPSNTTDGTQITAQSLQVQINELAEAIESGDIEVKTDTTLSVSGMPADAKVVGSAIGDTLQPTYANLEVVNGGYYTVSAIDGSLNLNTDTSSTYAHTSLNVDSGDVLLISLRHTTVNDSIIFTDNNNNVIEYYMKRSETSQTLVDQEYTVPRGATKVYLTTTIAVSISVVVSKPTSLSTLDSLCRTIRGSVSNSDSYETVSFVTNTNSNFVVSAVTGKLVQNNSESTSFVSTNIPCVEGEVYKITFRHTSLLDSVVIANEDLTALKTYYPRSYSSSVNITDLLVQIPQGGVLLCVSSTNAVPIVIKKATIAQSKKIIVALDGSGDYTKLSDAILNATDGSEIFVKQGTYDIVSELGASYFSNYVWDSSNPNYGLTMPPNSKIKFASGAKMVCNYTGSNDAIKEQWSPLASTQGNVTYEDVVIEASNVKYCIHDEHGGYAEPYTVVFNRCNLYLDDSNNTLSYSKSCIGGGLGWYGTIEVKNCIVESVGTSIGGTVSYHTQVGGNGSSCAVNIHNNYFVGSDNTARVYSAYTGSGSQNTVATINNNSLGKAYMTDTIVKSYAYLNEVRS